MLKIPVGCVQRFDWCHLLKVDRALTFDYKFVIKFHGACLCSCIHPGSTPAMKEIITACSFCSGENSQLMLFFHLVFPILLLGFGCELKGQLMYRKPKRLLISLLILRSGMVLPLIVRPVIPIVSINTAPVDMIGNHDFQWHTDQFIFDLKTVTSKLYTRHWYFWYHV